MSSAIPLRVALLVATLAVPGLSQSRKPPRDSTKAAPRSVNVPPVVADTEKDAAVDESDEQPPVFSTGLTAGALRRDAGRTDQALAAVLQWQPAKWLVITAAPSYGRSQAPASGTGDAPLAASSASGWNDVPLSLGLSHDFDAVSWKPTLGASLSATVATGDSASELGLGHPTSDLGVVLGAKPIERVNVSIGTSHPLTSGSGNGSLNLEGALSLGPATATLSFSNEIGTPDSGAVLAQSLAAGVAFTVLGPLTLTVDGSHGLSTGAPGWSVSVGLGTAFAGISPLGVTSPLRRLKRVLGKKTVTKSGFKRRPSKTCKIISKC